MTESQYQVDQSEMRAFVRLRDMGGRANEASFDATEYNAIKQLIARGVVRRVGRFQVAIVSAPEPVYKLDGSSQASQVREMDGYAGDKIADGLQPESKSSDVPKARKPKGIIADQASGKARRAVNKGFAHLDPVGALGARILGRISDHGTMTKRDLERKLNKNKQPLWPRAWAMLLATNCIQVSSTGSRRQQMVSLLEIPRDLEPRTIIKRRKRKRLPTPWFRERLPEFLERDGYLGRAQEAEDSMDEDDPSALRPWRSAGPMILYGIRTVLFNS